MHVTSIKAPAFQGRHINHELGAANLIVGESFAGKTSEINALLIGLFGYVPPEKENVATFEYSSDPKELFVKVGFSDGRANQIVISNNDGSFSKNDENMPVKVPTVLMDIKEYFALTGQKRLKYVLERVDLRKSCYDDEELLRAMEFPKDGATELQLEKAKEVAKVAREWVKTRARKKQPIVEWMSDYLTALKNDERDIRSEIKANQAVLDQDEEPAPKAVSDADIQAADKAVQDATLAIGQFMSKRDSKAEDDLMLEIAKAHGNLSNLERDVADLDKEAEKMAKAKRCPTCHADGKDWLKQWKADEARDRKMLYDAIAETNKDIASLQKKLAKLRESKQDDKGRARLDRQLSEAQEARRSLRQLRDRWVSHQGVLSARKQAAAQIESGKAEQAVLKHCIAKLVECQEELVQNTFGALLKIANQFTSGILRGPLIYKDGDIGYMRGGTFARRLSGSEQLLAYAGLQVALAQESPIKLVVMDEMGRMPDTLKQAFAHRMLELIHKGVIDQWIGVDVSSSWLTGPLRTQVAVTEVV